MQMRMKMAEKFKWIFFNTVFVSNHRYLENPEETQVIVGSMEYISDTARNRTHNLFRPKQEPIPLGHSDGHTVSQSYRNKVGWEEK